MKMLEKFNTVILFSCVENLPLFYDNLLVCIFESSFINLLFVYVEKYNFEISLIEF